MSWWKCLFPPSLLLGNLSRAVENAIASWSTFRSVTTRTAFLLSFSGNVTSNIAQYYSFYCIVYHINAALMIEFRTLKSIMFNGSPGEVVVQRSKLLACNEKVKALCDVSKSGVNGRVRVMDQSPRHGVAIIWLECCAELNFGPFWDKYILKKYQKYLIFRLLIVLSSVQTKGQCWQIITI